MQHQRMNNMTYKGIDLGINAFSIVRYLLEILTFYFIYGEAGILTAMAILGLWVSLECVYVCIHLIQLYMTYTNEALNDIKYLLQKGKTK